MLRILLADDSLPSLAACQALIEKMGHDVHVTDNGLDALKVAKSKEFDLIILDEYMPGACGSHVAQSIRRTKNPNTKVPIIALSGVTSSAERKEMLDKGISGHLTKPITGSDLETLLLRYQSLPEVIIDDTVLISMRDDLGGAVFNKLLKLFKEELQILFERMKKGLHENDFEEVLAVTHIWKNSAALYGAQNLAEKSRKLNELPPSDRQELRRAAEEVLNVARVTLESVENTEINNQKNSTLRTAIQ